MTEWFNNYWDSTGYVINKALDEVEVPITVKYEFESWNDGRFPVIYTKATYEDDDGYEQDYALSENEVDRIYEEVYEAMKDEPIYDEYGGAL